ncbi:MAG: ROK family protein [Acidimicrobiales bacterium]
MIADTGRVLAIDIGGTKLAAGVVTREGELIERSHVPTPTNTDGAGLFAALLALVEPHLSAGPFVAYGVGCGGPMTRGGRTVSPLNIASWREFPLLQQLEATTAAPVFIENDAKALALAEGWVGAAVGESDYLAMVVSTGVGGGIVLNGKLLEGAGGNAGHIGHVVVEPDGFAHVGHVPGVLEAEASGRAIAAKLGRPAAEATAEDVVQVGTYVGRAVGSVANLLDLKLALVAGSVALGYGELFFAAAQAEIDRICQLDFSRGTVIRPAGCGDEGPLIGAAAVALRGLGLLPIG